MTLSLSKIALDLSLLEPVTEPPQNTLGMLVKH